MIGYVEQCVTFMLFYRRLPYMGMVPLMVRVTEDLITVLKRVPMFNTL